MRQYLLYGRNNKHTQLARNQGETVVDEMIVELECVANFIAYNLMKIKMFLYFMADLLPFSVDPMTF